MLIVLLQNILPPELYKLVLNIFPRIVRCWCCDRVYVCMYVLLDTSIPHYDVSSPAPQVALRNMKDRYHKLQRKVSLLEDDNQRLITGKSELFGEIGKLQVLACSLLGDLCFIQGKPNHLPLYIALHMLKLLF